MCLNIRAQVHLLSESLKKPQTFASWPGHQANNNNLRQHVLVFVQLVEMLAAWRKDLKTHSASGGWSKKNYGDFDADNDDDDDLSDDDDDNYMFSSSQRNPNRIGTRGGQ